MPRGSLSRFRDAAQISHGKFDYFLCTPAGSTIVTLDSYGLRHHWLARPLTLASYPVSVRQVANLLGASFRPSLTATPLRFATLHRYQVV
jgi:hypothetical protein